MREWNARGALDRSMTKGMDDVSLAQEQGQMNAEYSCAYICARCEYGGLIKTFSNLTTLAWMDIGVRMLVCLLSSGWLDACGSCVAYLRLTELFLCAEARWR